MLGLLQDAVEAHNAELAALLREQGGGRELRLIVETEDFGVTWRAAKWKLPAFAMCTGGLLGDGHGAGSRLQAVHLLCMLRCGSDCACDRPAACLLAVCVQQLCCCSPGACCNSYAAQLPTSFPFSPPPSRRQRPHRHPGARFHVQVLPGGAVQEQQLAVHSGGTAEMRRLLRGRMQGQVGWPAAA